MAENRTPTLYYVATKKLAEAMRTGKKCNKGTVYGVFEDPVRAYTFRFERGLMLVTEVVEQ